MEMCNVYEGEFSNGKMHGKGTFKYAAGGVLKSIGEWREGKKFGLFEDIVRKQVYYDNDELNANSDVTVKCEEASDEDTDTDDVPPKKRRNGCVSPPEA